MPESNNNPFTFGSMITDPARFVGRRAELKQIVGRLNGIQPQGAAVVGPRRIGKSSLLHYLYRPRSGENQRAGAGQRVVYLDAQRGDCETPDTFRKTLVRLLIEAEPPDRRTREGKRLHEATQSLAMDNPWSWAQVRGVCQIDCVNGKPGGEA